MLAVYDLGAMFGQLDLLALTKGAGMLGYNSGAVEQSDSAVVGDQGQSAFDMIWRHRIDIGFAAHRN